MKHYISAFAALSLSVVLIPAVPVYLSGRAGNIPQRTGVSPAETEKAPPKNTEAPTAPEAASAAEEKAPDCVSEKPYRVLDVSSGEILEVPVRDYVIGAVCAEMPASFEPEALKAQAAAAHTYAERQRIREEKAPTAELMGADFSNDTSKYQGYFTDAQIKKFFGESYEESLKKISAAADEVLPYIITYKDEPIISAFHSISSGTTESAENAWGAPVDYLVPVDSSSDLSAPNYMSEVRYKKDVLKNKLETAFPNVTLGKDMKKWLSVKETSPSGTVLTASLGDATVSGSELRSALGLRSPCFSIRFENNEAVFTAKGYGHGVGMSQYGANSMAADGASWQEIIKHYYPECKITKISS